MWGTENIISKNVGRTNRNLLVTNVVILGFLGLIFFCSWRANYNLVFGPWAVTDTALLKMDPTKELQYNVKMKVGDRLSKPVYEQFSIRKDKSGNEKSRSTTALYQLLIVADEQAVKDKSGRVLLVKSPGGVTAGEISGGLVPIPEDLVSECIQGVEKQMPALEGRFLPFMLDTSKFDAWNYLVFVFQIPVLILCLWKLKSFIERNNNPNVHPIMKGISAYGDPRSVSAEIEDDLRMSNGGKRKGIPGIWTNKWVLMPTTFDLLVGKLDDLVWIYTHETKHSVNFIPTGSTWKLMMHFANKQCIEVDTKKENVEKLLLELLERVPWAYAGFSEELKGCWQKQPQAMIDESAKARRELSVKTPPAPEDM